MKQFLILGMFTLFLACGNSSNERGIPAVTNDPSASGSAYKSSDGFAPATTTAAPAVAHAAPATAPIPVADSVVVVTPGAATVPAVKTPNAIPVAAAKPAAADDSADIKKGETLISKSDCLACHKVDAKLLGPSYKDVANKYPNNAATVSQLVSKIKKGGSGVWGAIPMSPHPALSDDDAKAMVKYILSLK